MMDEMMKQLMAKKGAQKMSTEDQQAKLDVIKELLEMATQAMGGKIKGGMDEMQKVSVMAPDKKSLLEGLGMAQDIAGGDPETEELEEQTGQDLDGDNEEGESADHVAKVEGKGELASELSGLEGMGMKKKKRPLFSMMDDEDEE